MEEQDKINLIANSSGKELYTFWRTLLNKIKNQDDVSNSKKYFDLCMKRAKEVFKDRFGNWEQALMEVNHMPIPTGYLSSTNLLPVFGYPLQFVVSKKGTFLALMNPKTNFCHIRNTSQNFSTKEAVDIFNS